MKKDIKLIICDIDNTIVMKHLNLSDRMKRVITELKKQGIIFGLASGRSIDDVKRGTKRWGFEEFDVIVGLNGSALWDGLTDERYHYYELKREWIKEIIEKMSIFENNIVMYRGDTFLCHHIDEQTKESAKAAEMEMVRPNDISDFYAEDNAKIMFRVREEDMPKIEEYLNANPSPYYAAFKTQSTMLEFADRRVSKSYALEKFCEFHDLPMDCVMAMGDTTNDNTMLQAAGVGVCMCNGSEDTLAIADLITDKTCNEDGCADFLEKYFNLFQD